MQSGYLVLFAGELSLPLDLALLNRKIGHASILLQLKKGALSHNKTDGPPSPLRVWRRVEAPIRMCIQCI